MAALCSVEDILNPSALKSKSLLQRNKNVKMITAHIKFVFTCRTAESLVICDHHITFHFQI